MTSSTLPISKFLKRGKLLKARKLLQRGLKVEVI